jgi:hypothetical protein
MGQYHCDSAQHSQTFRNRPAEKCNIKSFSFYIPYSGVGKPAKTASTNSFFIILSSKRNLTFIYSTLR